MQIISCHVVDFIRNYIRGFWKVKVFGQYWRSYSRCI